MVSSSELGEHRNDPSQHRLALCIMNGSQHFAGFETVLNRCAFQRRTACDLEESAPIGIGSFAVAFGDVQRDRLRGAQQLVPSRPIEALQTLGQFVRSSHIPNRNLVDIELLMSELH